MPTLSAGAKRPFRTLRWNCYLENCKAPKDREPITESAMATNGERRCMDFEPYSYLAEGRERLDNTLGGSTIRFLVVKEWRRRTKPTCISMVLAHTAVSATFHASKRCMTVVLHYSMVVDSFWAALNREIEFPAKAVVTILIVKALRHSWRLCLILTQSKQHWLSGQCHLSSPCYTVILRDTCTGQPWRCSQQQVLHILKTAT